MLKGGYQVFKGITFNGKSSYKDLGLTMNPERTIGIPNKRKIKITPAFSNMAVDFSGLYGSQPYDERELVYRFNIGGRKISDKNTMNMVKTKVINWLMGTTGKTKLYDDNIKGYYFLAEVEGNSAFVEDWKMGVLEVTFTAYPFMIAELKEGHDIWDDFNFELDVSQNLNFEAKRTDFKPVSIGSYGTVGAWSTAYDGLEAIPKRSLGQTHKIIEKRTTTQDESSVAYLLEDLNKWVIEQDIVQAQNGVTKVNIINSGVTSVTPKITSTYPVSIVKGNYVFNIFKGVSLSHLFKLNEGDNHIEITGNHHTLIDFEFHKELI